MADVNFRADCFPSSIHARVTLEAGAAFVGLEVLDVIHLNVHSVSSFNLESSEDIPKRFAFLQIHFVQRKAGEELSVNGELELGVGEGYSKLEWLVDCEWECL